MEKSDYIQLGIMIGTLVATLITAYALYQSVKHFKKQLQLNFFADYTKRYQEIMLNFPESINEEKFDFESLDPATRNTTKRYMRAYFDLCSEEYFLWKNKNIDNETWEEWKSGIEYAFSKTAFQKGWKFINLDTIYYEDFAVFADKAIQKSKTG